MNNEPIKCSKCGKSRNAMLVVEENGLKFAFCRDCGNDLKERLVEWLREGKA